MLQLCVWVHGVTTHPLLMARKEEAQKVGGGASTLLCLATAPAASSRTREPWSWLHRGSGAGSHGCMVWGEGQPTINSGPTHPSLQALPPPAAHPLLKATLCSRQPHGAPPSPLQAALKEEKGYHDEAEPHAHLMLSTPCGCRQLST